MSVRLIGGPDPKASIATQTRSREFWRYTLGERIRAVFRQFVVEKARVKVLRHFNGIAPSRKEWAFLGFCPHSFCDFCMKSGVCAQNLKIV